MDCYLYRAFLVLLNTHCTFYATSHIYPFTHTLSYSTLLEKPLANRHFYTENNLNPSTDWQQLAEAHLSQHQQNESPFFQDKEWSRSLKQEYYVHTQTGHSESPAIPRICKHTMRKVDGTSLGRLCSCVEILYILWMWTQTELNYERTHSFVVKHWCLLEVGKNDSQQINVSHMMKWQRK